MRIPQPVDYIEEHELRIRAKESPRDYIDSAVSDLFEACDSFARENDPILRPLILSRMNWLREFIGFLVSHQIQEAQEALAS